MVAQRLRFQEGSLSFTTPIIAGYSPYGNMSKIYFRTYSSEDHAVLSLDRSPLSNYKKVAPLL